MIFDEVVTPHGSQRTRVSRDTIDVTSRKTHKGYNRRRKLLFSGGRIFLRFSVRWCRYHVESGRLQRVNFIAREHSRHGNIVGALSMSGHIARRAAYFLLLSPYV
jgi:hypothetical protein